MASNRKGFAQIIALVAFVLIALAAVAFWYFSSQAKPPAPIAQLPPPAPAPVPAPVDVSALNSLGATIYAQSQNPIQGKVPSTDPAVNPIQGAYKNPFE